MKKIHEKLVIALLLIVIILLVLIRFPLTITIIHKQCPEVICQPSVCNCSTTVRIINETIERIELVNSKPDGLWWINTSNINWSDIEPIDLPLIDTTWGSIS